MECAAYREAVSARIDGEDCGLEVEAVDAHLADCSACRSWAETAIAVTRSARIGLAEPVPDLANDIVSAIVAAAGEAAPGRVGTAAVAGRRAPGRVGAATSARRAPGRVGSPSNTRWASASKRRFVPASPANVARWGLVMVSLAQACLAIPALLGHDVGAPVHVAHEQGAWALALAVAMAVVAIRPARAASLLPFVAALSTGLAITMMVDIAAGNTEAAAEAPHGLAFLGLGMLWLLSRHSSATASSTRPTAGRPGMAEAA